MRKQKTLLILSIYVCVAFNSAFAQFNSTTYYMRNLPQAANMNPAFQPGYNFYLALPSITMDINNNAINFDNFIKYNSEIDSFYTPLSYLATDEEKDAFINIFDDLNTISSSFNAEIFKLGFRVNDNFFSFNISERIAMNMDYPGDLMRFLIKGNSEAGIFDFSGFGGRINAYQEIGLSFSNRVSNSFSFGVRGKILFGQFNMSMSKQDITFDVDTFAIDVSSNFAINGSSPFHKIEITNGEFDSIVGTGFNTDKIIETLLGKQNMGFGLDIGLDYNVTDRLSLSASVLDLGIITWKNNVFNLSADSANFTFEGIELDFFQSQEISDQEDTATFFGQLADSVKSEFGLNGGQDPFTTFLTAKVIFGLNYKLLEGFDIGLLSYNQIYRQKIIPRLTVSANFRPARFLNASFSYSLLNQEYYGMGVGLSFKPGPFNWFVIGDTFPLVVTSGIPVPKYAKGFRFQAGFNFVFGSAKKRQSERDLPLWF